MHTASIAPGRLVCTHMLNFMERGKKGEYCVVEQFQVLAVAVILDKDVDVRAKRHDRCVPFKQGLGLRDYSSRCGCAVSGAMDTTAA